MELKSDLAASQKAGDQLKREHQGLLEWKNEKESLINETEAVQRGLTDQIGNLQKNLISMNEATDQLKVKGTAEHYVLLCS